MQTGNGRLKEKVIEDLLARKCRSDEAALELGVTVRTVQNYIRRFLENGPEGLKDQRTGNHQKLTPSDKAAVVACKEERPQRSARCIRDRLGLRVSEEAVRLVLVKHHMNGKGPIGIDERSNLDQNLPTR